MTCPHCNLEIPDSTVIAAASKAARRGRGRSGRPAKLVGPLAAKVLRMRAAGGTVVTIGEALGMAPSTIYRFLERTK